MIIRNRTALLIRPTQPYLAGANRVEDETNLEVEARFFKALIGLVEEPQADQGRYHPIREMLVSLFEQAWRDGKLDAIHPTDPVSDGGGGWLTNAGAAEESDRNQCEERALLSRETDEISDTFVWRGPGLRFMGPTCSCGRQ